MNLEKERPIDRENDICWGKDGGLWRMRSGHHPEWEKPAAIVAQTRLTVELSQVEDLFARDGVSIGEGVGLSGVEVDRKRMGLGTGYLHQQDYIDGDIGLFFRFGGRSWFVLGFDLHNERQVLEVRQLQQIVRGAGRVKGRWERVLLSYGIDAAKKLNYREVEVLPASENGWVRANRLPLERARLRYDVVAKKSGFVLDQERKRYVMKVG